MKPPFSFSRILVALAVVFLIIGGYVGYLSALVDIDQELFIDRVSAVTDKERLERQLARAESILDARRRAYIRRSLAFIEEERASLNEGPVSLPQSVSSDEVRSTDSLLREYTDRSGLTAEQSTMLLALQEERTDLQFFEDEVNTLEELIAREFTDEEIQLLSSGDRQLTRLSGALRRLLQLLDKQKELSEQREIAKEQFSFWERNPQGTPGGVEISVYNKGLGERELNPVHITQISTGLSIMPSDFDSRLKRLYIVYGDPEMRRGMSGVGVVFMKGEELDFFRVLVHEFGHIYDLHREVLTGTKSNFYDGPFRLYQGDPSVTYFGYSWESNAVRTADLDGFASSYGTTDPFEDFAEAFALYVLQGRTFREWRDEDPVMDLKYSFIKDMYNGREFASQNQYLTRPYDVTMLEVNYDQLLAVQ